jgi:hypothetical protein
LRKGIEESRVQGIAGSREKLILLSKVSDAAKPSTRILAKIASHFSTQVVSDLALEETGGGGWRDVFPFPEARIAMLRSGRLGKLAMATRGFHDGFCSRD